MKIDLHIHSNYSDGQLTPFEIIDIAYLNNINTISITDHDTIDAYKKKLFEYAKKKNIKLINGVEISTKYNKIGIHILGYNIDLNNKQLKEKLLKLRNSRHDYLFNVGYKLKELGYKIDLDKLDTIEAVTKAHIALNIVENKDNNELLIKEFGHIPNMGEFIETIMNEGCIAYVEKETITPKEASHLIKNANGYVVLAHPVAYFYEDNLDEQDIDNIIKDMDIDAIESNYIYIDKNNIKHNDINKWTKYAKKHNLKTTTGSDFHKDDNIHPTIGTINKKATLFQE